MFDDSTHSQFSFQDAVSVMVEKGKGYLVLSLLILLSWAVILYLFIDLNRTKTEHSPVKDESIVVDLSGAVVSPGIYVVPNESHIADVLSMGEGFTSEASQAWVSKNINLAKKVSDEEKIYIPFEWELEPQEVFSVALPTGEFALGTSSIPSARPETVSVESTGLVDMALATEKVNVNNASQSELESLPGIGKVYSQRIISNRPYQTVQDLVDLALLPQATVDKISSSIEF